MITDSLDEYQDRMEGTRLNLEWNGYIMSIIRRNIVHYWGRGSPSLDSSPSSSSSLSTSSSVLKLSNSCSFNPVKSVTGSFFSLNHVVPPWRHHKIYEEATTKTLLEGSLHNQNLCLYNPSDVLWKAKAIPHYWWEPTNQEPHPHHSLSQSGHPSCSPY